MTAWGEDDVGGGITSIVGRQRTGHHDALREPAVGAVPKVAGAGGVEGGVQRKAANIASVHLTAEGRDVRAMRGILDHARHMKDLPVGVITEAVDRRVARVLWGGHPWPGAVTRPARVEVVLQLLHVAVCDVQMVP